MSIQSGALATNGPRCPKDQSLMFGLQGVDGSFFRCTTCQSSFLRRDTGELVETVRIDPSYIEQSVLRIEAWSTGTLDRLSAVEAFLDGLRESAAVSGGLSRAEQDAQVALDNARGAQTAARQLQVEVRSLQKSIEELNLRTLRTRVDELEGVVERHVKEHRETSK